MARKRDLIQVVRPLPVTVGVDTQQMTSLDPLGATGPKRLEMDLRSHP